MFESIMLIGLVVVWVIIAMINRHEDQQIFTRVVEEVRDMRQPWWGYRSCPNRSIGNGKDHITFRPVLVGSTDMESTVKVTLAGRYSECGVSRKFRLTLHPDRQHMTVQLMKRLNPRRAVVAI